MPLDREKAKARRTEVVDLSDLLGPGQSVTVRSLTVIELALFELSLTDEEGNTIPSQIMRIRELMVIASACEDDGRKPLFTEKDLPELSNWNAAVLDRIYQAANRLSGRKGSKQKKAEIEQKKGN
ncbi:MAG: hypothetical protein AB7G12_12790 [Thermoanaerobaculia bacterium]